MRKQKSGRPANALLTWLLLRETGSELTPSRLRLPSQPICDSSHVFVHNRDHAAGDGRFDIACRRSLAGPVHRGAQARQHSTPVWERPPRLPLSLS